ncbi:MAG: hypothetical protein QXW98_07515 [Candidatus Caldarchaeum sp.]
MQRTEDDTREGDNMIDDMESLIRYVLLAKLEGYEFDGVFEHMKVPEGVRWGVQVKKQEGGIWDVKTHISKFYVTYPRRDVEEAVRAAVEEFDIFLKSCDDEKNIREEQIEKIADYHAQTIRLESLLRRMRAWYHRRMSQ